ncbi:MAG: hypothetical protein SF069_15890 [Phycisphaerae bacterium]|nr:hypothetical protein [Phycisphaerae bacterium]
MPAAVTPPLALTPELRAPRDHLGLLVEEFRRDFPIADDSTMVSSARSFRDALDVLRREVRAELGLPGRVRMAGHQAEFYHAGVFAKEIAIGQWAVAGGESPAFLIVDSDLPKHTSITIPEIGPRGLRRVELKIPGVDPRCITAAQPALPRSAWVSFFADIAQRTEHYEASLLRAFNSAWCEPSGDALAEPDAPIDFILAFDRARRASLTALRLPDVPSVRVSQLCRTPAFHAFVRAIAADAERFARDHNAAIDAYRVRHGVSAANRPVAPLEVRADRVELPFWRIRADGARTRLFAPSSANAALQPIELAAGEWIAPRALTLTAFARLLLAEQFVHGIGGALYDEITEQFTASYFGVRLPTLVCVTATAHLPLPRHGVGQRELLAARRRARDWQHNPQRVAENPSGPLLAELIQLAGEIREARAAREPIARRVVLHEQIIELKDRLRAASELSPAELESAIDRAEAAFLEDQIASDREYFFALHTVATLKALAASLSRGPT